MQSIYDNVYGLSYKAAFEQMQLVVEAIKQQRGVGFEELEDLEIWANDHHLNKVVFSNMSHQFMCVSHKGEIMLPNAFEHYYGDVLFWVQQLGKKSVLNKWHPEGFEYFDRAYVFGEQGDGVHRPLYYRDYHVPTGYYNEDKDAFNIAKPFPVFAAETYADTSHIYSYIEHIAGECAMWLLAWLRAKLLYPTVKTQVVPIIVSRAQGSGKTTFAEVICKGLFGKDNVIVSDQYDATARFNADYADALIVCQEEKEEIDKRNPAGTLKSRATATTIRKELKGIDPIYQESYTDFIMTTNKDVPIKFDGREDQRRFMVMEADEHFTRKESTLADEVFTKLYGYDANYHRVCTPFTEDKQLIAQFKHELFTREDIKAVKLREFPHTSAYKRCFTLPRTSEASEIESILRSLMPFIKQSLIDMKIAQEYGDLQLADFIQVPNALQYMPAFREHIAYVALCRPLVFTEMVTNKPMAHSTVERGIYDCAPWIKEEFGIAVMPDMDPLPGGFTYISGRYRTAPAAKFCLAEEYETHRPAAQVHIEPTKLPAKPKIQRIGERLRVDSNFRINNNGCYETVNEMRPGTHTLADKTKNVRYLDTFLFESDTPTKLQEEHESLCATKFMNDYGEDAVIEASVLYKERLSYALTESKRLFDDGIAARIVYSGAKSYHILVRVADAPSNIDEYKWLHAHLCQVLSSKLIFDESTSDPARLTRSPLKMERVSEAYGLKVHGVQELVLEDWSHVFDIRWRLLYEQWKRKPLSKREEKRGKPLYPTRKEYIDAADAIISGTFWTDNKYDGDRQRLFFPSYRLLRILGYSHEAAWDSVILPKLSSYKKQDEIGYWKSRENSVIIRNIDEEIDTYEEEFNG